MLDKILDCLLKSKFSHIKTSPEETLSIYYLLCLIFPFCLDATHVVVKNQIFYKNFLTVSRNIDIPGIRKMTTEK